MDALVRPRRGAAKPFPPPSPPSSLFSAVAYTYQARRQSPTGRAQPFILDGSPDGRRPPAGGPRPASRDLSRDRRRKRDPSATPPRTVGTPPTAW
eukprot:354287-Chlamydomonas_euryale.AAC.2